MDWKALEKMEKQFYSLVISDIRMAEFNRNGIAQGNQKKAV